MFQSLECGAFFILFSIFTIFTDVSQWQRPLLLGDCEILNRVEVEDEEEKMLLIFKVYLIWKLPLTVIMISFSIVEVLYMP